MLHILSANDGNILSEHVSICGLLFLFHVVAHGVGVLSEHLFFGGILVDGYGLVPFCVQVGSGAFHEFHGITLGSSTFSSWLPSLPL